jgi:hypothetical protein
MRGYKEANWDSTEGRIGAKSCGQPTADLACQVGALHRVEQFVIQRKNAASVGQRSFSRFHQTQSAPLLSEERYAEIVLEALHLQADRGRSAAELLRCLRKFSKVVRQGEGAERVQIKIDSRFHSSSA